MNLDKILIIARREFLFNVRRRMFLFTAFVVPLLSLGISFFAGSVSASQVEDMGGFKRVGVVDQAGLLIDSTLPAPYERIALETAESELKAARLEVYYILPTAYLRDGKVQSVSRVSVPLGLDSDFGQMVKKALAAKTGSPEIVTRLEDPVKKLEIRQPGSTQIFDENVLFSALFAPLIIAVLQLVAILTTSQFLMSSVVEEKENRMMEVLTTSSRPAEMLWGKLLGLGALGLVQIFLWGAVGFLVLLARGPENLGVTLASLQLTPATLVLILVYFIFGYLLNGAIMAGVGASVNAEMESRQFSSIFGLVGAIPLIFLAAFLTDPDGPLPTFLSIFPFTSPISMIMRLTFTTVPPVQIGLSIILLVLSVAVVIWVAARVFRLGMLSYGKRLGLRDVIRAIREANPIAVQPAPKEA